MAFADLGSLGATGSTANNQASLALTTAAAVAVNNLAVIVVAVDNKGSSDGEGNDVSGVTDSAGNTWTKAADFANAQGGAQAGAAVSLWYTRARFALALGGTITATFTTNTTSDASGLTARKFSLDGVGVAVEGTPGTLPNDGADPGSLDVTTSNIACLRIRGIAAEVGNDTALTPTASWQEWANGNSATSGTTGEMCARAEHIISTGTGAASNPTYVSADCASVYVAFREIPAQPWSRGPNVQPTVAQ